MFRPLPYLNLRGHSNNTWHSGKGRGVRGSTKVSRDTFYIHVFWLKYHQKKVLNNLCYCQKWKISFQMWGTGQYQQMSHGGSKNNSKSVTYDLYVLLIVFFRIKWFTFTKLTILNFYVPFSITTHLTRFSFS